MAAAAAVVVHHDPLGVVGVEHAREKVEGVEALHVQEEVVVVHQVSPGEGVGQHP